MTRAVALATCVVAAVIGCSGPAEVPIGPTFAAQDQDFARFRTWTSFHDDLETGGYTADVLGPRTQYINQLPAHGATEFPIGTIIVEARESGAMPIFAAVKRGGGFNASGALDWEWFELSEVPDVHYLWRGSGPMNSETYGGDQNACNSCHAACGAGNDFVCSPKLQLSQF